MANLISRLSCDLFWDVDRKSIDPVQHKQWIIERILNYGTGSDVRQMLARYSTEEIKETLHISKKLNRKAALFWSLHYKLKKNEVPCTNPQSAWR